MASLMGCADMGTKAPANKAIDADQPLSQSASSLAKGEIEPDEVVDAEAIKYRGNDQVIGLPPARDPISFVGDAVALSFENAPLSEVTHASTLGCAGHRLSGRWPHSR